ncbi:hypothetical protein [Streptomyces huiliensis]|uniref:hypothetical protein n=1 Tax=Streptomyces huiliensis TaxID=2876027 RepID=UPI001CBD41DE|nr:hypothetical protein [Streptomyces huiliensis]MBZ4319542.1 hypothetical protein [Streptomyces huiliensis]
MITFLRTHPARIYAVLVATVALVVHYVPDLPDALILAVAAAVLGVGETVQRTEDGKTRAAGIDDQGVTDSPFEVGE